jgi:LPXTG-motif cell wall-anchored protein
MKKIILIIILFPLFLFADSDLLTVGEETVSYETVFSTETGTLYYKDEKLVASEHEAVTLIYKDDLPVFEAHDTDGDGTLDTFITLDSNENITNISGPGAKTFTRPETVEFSTLLSERGTDNIQEDLVGNLDSIDIPRYHNYTLYVIIILLIAGAFWWYRRKRK